MEMLFILTITLTIIDIILYVHINKTVTLVEKLTLANSELLHTVTKEVAKMIIRNNEEELKKKEEELNERASRVD